MLRILRVLAFGCLLCVPILCLSDPHPAVLVLSLDGVVHPVTVGVLDKAFSQAYRENDRLVLIRINTPGGFADATRAAVEKIVASRVPVAIWVGPSGARAASAGFFLLQASDIAAMAPGTNTGAAHPVMLVGQPDQTLMKKIESDSAASLRSVMTHRARNAALGELAVTESRSFSDKEAIANGLIDIVATDAADLIRQLNGWQIKRFDGSTTTLDLNGATVIEYKPSLSQLVQSATSDPNIAIAALFLGLLLLYVEFSTPGLIFPGVAGSVLLLIGLSALSVLPVTATGVLLLLLSVELLVLEMKIASHGVLGAGAVVSMVLGAVFLIDSPLPELRIRWSTALLVALPFAAIMAFLIGLAIRARRAPVRPQAGICVGQSVHTLTACSPTGQVRLHGEIWSATASVPLAAGQEARVTGIHGLQLEVEPKLAATLPKNAAVAAGG